MIGSIGLSDENNHPVVDDIMISLSIATAKTKERIH
jgi:hypothetical protein